MRAEAARRVRLRKIPAREQVEGEEPFGDFFARSLRRAPALFAVLVAFVLIRATGARAAAVLLLAAGFAILPLTLLRPELGLYALVVNDVNGFDTYYGFSRYIPVSLPFALDAAIAVAILARFGSGRLPRLGYAQNLLIAAYVLLVTLSVAVSPVPTPPAYWTNFQSGFLIRPILYLFVILLVRTPRQLHRFLLVFVAAHAVLMLGSLLDYLQKGGGLYRVSGTLGAINYLSYVCIATLPILIALFAYLRGALSRAAMGALALTTLFVTMQTLSRSGYYSLIATLGFMGWRLSRNPRMLAIAVAFAGLFYLLVPTGLSERLSEVAGVTENSRYYLSRVALRMALGHPLLGVGLHGYEIEFPKYDTESLFGGKHKAAHSVYFGIAASSGFPALLLYVATYAVTLLQTFRVERRYAGARDFRSLGYHLTLGVEGGLFGHLVFGFAGTYADSYYAYMLLALAVVLVRYHKEHPAPAVLV